MKSLDDTTKALNLNMLSRLHHKWVPPFHLFFYKFLPFGKSVKIPPSSFPRFCGRLLQRQPWRLEAGTFTLFATMRFIQKYYRRITYRYFRYKNRTGFEDRKTGHDTSAVIFRHPYENHHRLTIPDISRIDFALAVRHRP